jgi:hypothetical protein
MLTKALQALLFCIGKIKLESSEAFYPFTLKIIDVISYKLLLIDTFLQYFY